MGVFHELVLDNVANVNTKLLLGVGGILFGLIAFVLSRRQEKLSGMPVMTGYGLDHEQAMMDGTLKYPTTPFIVETQEPYVIVPTCCFEELKNISQKKATFWGIQRQDMLAKFIGIFRHNPQLNQALRFDLNRNMASILNLIQDNISWVLDKELGHDEEWKTFGLHQFTVLIVARLVAGVFVGPRFIQDDEWTKMALGLAVEILSGRDHLKRYPTVFHPVIGWFLPEVRRINQRISRMAEKLQPVIDSSVLKSSTQQQPYDEEKQDLESSSSAGEGTFMSWILKRLGTADAEILARAQVSLSFASVNTTTGALVFIFLDLASFPEYIQPLRDEIEEVVKEDGIEEDENGVLRFKQASLAKLWKMDSFMNESGRLSSRPVTNMRLTMEPLTLSTGHRIPKGTRLAFNARAIHMSTQTQTFSPDYNPPENKPPNEFDGFRFYRLRKMVEKEKQHSFVAAWPESLNWGYGIHACPARFFADNEMKIILIELLRKWDIRVTDPTRTNTETERKMVELQLDPPKNAKIQLRRRKVATC